MANFKINLLTPMLKTADINKTGGSTHFLESTISEFYSQEQVYSNSLQSFGFKTTFCHTFNEKISLHKNGQKELTFSMLKNIWVDDQYVTNPFVDALKVGVQLLVIDKDQNEYIFSIKNVDYTISNANITYEVTCQDSFSYQAVRQNAGYSIENDSSSEDFIGAKNIDWWVYNKIQPECHIGYQYIPLYCGLFKNKKGQVKIYRQQSDLIDVDKILKTAYNAENHSDYFTTIPFSVSNSNAAAALIELGDQVGLMLNTFEGAKINEQGQRTTEFLRYFWFEPVKHEEVSGLKYSPYSNIQSFSFSHAGDSLATVLNVESSTFDDEVISLLPSIPTFFSNLFQTNQWEKSSFYDGYFSSICQHIVYRGGIAPGFDIKISSNADLINLDNKDQFISAKKNFAVVMDDQPFLYLYLPNVHDAHDLFNIPSQYDKISFALDSEESELYIETQRYSPYLQVWQFVTEVDDGQGSYKEAWYNDSYSLIPAGVRPAITYLKIPLMQTLSQYEIKDCSLILNFYRDTTAEELEFAQIADECPWLENKLIDFSYFYDQGIINKSEYSALLNIIKNDLRIVNGQLLLYTKEYYNALHQKTIKIARLLEDIDSVGAAFQADVVDKYAEKGEIINIDYFQEAYNTLVSGSNWSTLNKTEILNYEDVLTEYGNKYIKSQQRFLKNIYNFRHYFYSPVSWTNADSNLCEHYIVIKNSPSEKEFITFEENTFKPINSEFNYYYKETGKSFFPLYEANQQAELKYVHSDNYRNYYVSNIRGNTQWIRSNGDYSSDRTYYRVTYKADKGGLDQIELPINDQNITFNKYKTILDYDYYAPQTNLQEIFIQSWPETIILNTIEYTLDYQPVVKKDLVNEFLQYQTKKTHSVYYQKNTDTYSYLNWISKKADIQELYDNFSVEQYVNAHSESVTEDINIESPGNKIGKSATFLNYIYDFPVSEVFIKSKVFKEANGDYEETEETNLYSLPLVTPETESHFFRRKLSVTNALWGGSNWKNSGYCWYDYDGKSINPCFKGYYKGSKTVYAPSKSSYKTFNKINNGVIPSNKYYYNYYSLRAETYYSIVQEDKKTNYQFKDSFIRPLTNENIINSIDSYKILVSSTKDLSDFIAEKINNEGRISSIIYYPIYNLLEDLDTSSIKWDSSYKTVEEILTILYQNQVKTTDNKYAFKIDRYYITIFREENFNFDSITSQNFETKRYSAYSGGKIYDSNYKEILFDENKDFSAGFYYQQEKNADFKLCDTAIFENGLSYYEDNGGTIPVYTIEQLKKQPEGKTYYYLDNTAYHYSSSSENDRSFTTTIYLHQIGQNNVDVNKINNAFLEIIKENDKWVLIYQSKKYDIDYVVKTTSVSNLTNGDFWYKYHNKIDNPVLSNHAALIETQLTEYWQQAYSASKSCEFFLPEYWQPQANGSNNYFSAEIISLVEDKLQLSNKYVPIVSIYKNKTIALPAYNLEYKTSNFVVDQTQDGQIINAKNQTLASIVFNDNIAMQSAFAKLGTEMSEWSVTNAGYKTTYYYRDSGGTKWDSLLRKIAPRLDFGTSHLNGIYLMMFKYLKNYFSNKKLDNYEKIKTRHDEIWDNLYQHFPGIVLETTYSNNDATTSNDLLVLAKHYFKDLSQPERGYNISFIDVATLKGYQGQELHIGDAIQLDAEEFYDEYDNIKRTLSQYLFITDISYDLRKDSGIQLTVNSIKYQEKLIQRLVKLIK